MKKQLEVIKYFSKAHELLKIDQKYWFMLFNGAIFIWNNYLPVFRNPVNDVKLLKELKSLLGSYFWLMLEGIKALEKKVNQDYELELKI